MSTAEFTTGLESTQTFSASTNPRRPRFPVMSNRQRPRGIKWYSRFVQLMKVLLPTVAALLVVLILVWPYLGSEDLRFRLSFAALTANETEDPSMVNPRYLGIDRENQSFSITADLARRPAEDSPTVELEMPKADITLDDGTWLVVTAHNGVYKQIKKTLELTGAVNMYHDSGYEFNTSKVSIDLEKGLAEGDAAVQGQGPFGDLRGEGFRLIDKGKTIVFTGKSKLVIYQGLGKLAK